MAPLSGAALSLGWALLLSSDSLALRLNWDSARYAGAFASGQVGWAHAPWNSHFALGPVYWTGHALVVPFGGGWVAGIRLLGAIALAATAAGMAVLLGAAGRGGSPVPHGREPAGLGGAHGAEASVPVAWALAYVTSWGLAVLVLTFEDNLLYLPWVVATLAWSVARLGRWRGRDSLGCGALCALGALVSWQAGLYLVVPLLAAAGPWGARTAPRSIARRLGDVALVPAGFAATIVAWVLLYAATAPGLTLRGLFGVLLSRPEPSFFPESWDDVWLLLRGPRRVLRHLGTGLMHEAGPMALESRAVRAVLPELGLAALAGTTLAWAVTAVRAWRRRAVDGRPAVTAFLLTVLLLLLIATSFYVDLPTDKYKRYEFVPLFLCILAARGLTRLTARWSARRPRARWLPVAIGLLAVLVQSVGVVAHARQFRARIGDMQPPGYHARDGVPWFVYFRRLREKTPERCLYVFTHAELAHGRYQLEIPTGLWDALPAHLVLAEGDDDRAALADWPVRVEVGGAGDAAALPACAWISPAARAALARAAAPAP